MSPWKRKYIYISYHIISSILGFNMMFYDGFWEVVVELMYWYFCITVTINLQGNNRPYQHLHSESWLSPPGKLNECRPQEGTILEGHESSSKTINFQWIFVNFQGVVLVDNFGETMANTLQKTATFKKQWLAPLLWGSPCRLSASYLEAKKVSSILLLVPLLLLHLRKQQNHISIHTA